MKKIVLLEFYEEFIEFRKYIQENGLNIAEFTLVVLQLKLQSQLKAAGIAFDTTLTYMNNDAFKRILLTFDNIHKYIDVSFDFEDDNGVKNAYKTELLYYVELLVNHIGGILELLQNIYNADKNMVLYASSIHRISSSVFLFEDRMLGLLVENFAVKNSITFHLYGLGKKHDAKPEPVAATVKKGSLIYPFFLKLIKLYANLFFKAQVIIPTTAYGFHRLINDIKRRVGKLLFIMPYERKVKWYKRYGGLVSGIFTGKFYLDINALPCGAYTIEQNVLQRKLDLLFRSMPDKLTSICGIDCRGIITSKVQTALTEHLCRMVRRSHEISKLVDMLDIKMFMSPWGRDIWYITAEQLKNLGRVSLFVSHGTHPVPVNKYHEISIFNMCRGFMLGDYSHIAVATPVQEAHLWYFKNKYTWLKNSEVKSGPLIFSDLNGTDRTMQRKRLGLSPEEVVLTHATSTKSRGTDRYYFLETSDELINSLSDLVDTVNNMKNARLIIRIHPGIYFSSEEMISLLPPSDKYIINSTGPFGDVLAATDILVSYSSTTIDEALLNGIPVLLYDKWDRYNHFSTGIYDDNNSNDIYPVCYVNRRDKLQSAIQFMSSKIQGEGRALSNMDRFQYRMDHREAFYRFIMESVENKGGAA